MQEKGLKVMLLLSGICCMCLGNKISICPMYLGNKTTKESSDMERGGNAQL